MPAMKIAAAAVMMFENCMVVKALIMLSLLSLGDGWLSHLALLDGDLEGAGGVQFLYSKV